MVAGFVDGFPEPCFACPGAISELVWQTFQMKPGPGQPP